MPLERESGNLYIPNAGSKQPVAPHSPEASTPEPLNETSPEKPPPEEHETPAPPSEQAGTENVEPTAPRISTRNRNPLRLARDLLSCMGSTDPSIARSLQLQRAFAKDAEEAEGVCSVEDGAAALLEDFNGLEQRSLRRERTPRLWSQR